MIGYPQCTKCSSDKFKSLHVSSSFLSKLKYKPRIPRENRYVKIKQKESKKYSSTKLQPSNNSEVTLEKLFKLNKQQIQYLFDQTYEEKSRIDLLPCEAALITKMPLKTEERDQELKQEPSNENKMWLRKASTMSLKKNSSVASLFSRKPLNCPHDPCKKIIAISSFYSHFKYDHPEIAQYMLERGAELCLPFDVTKLEHNKTICLGLIRVYDKYKRKSCTKLNVPSGSHIFKNNHHQRVPVDTFWIMMSGSPDEIQSHAYVLIWIFTNNNDYYNCTIEVSSENDNVCYSTFCGVNDMHDSQNITEIAQRLNCLYLSYGSVKNIFQYGLDTQLRIAIH